MEETDCYNCVKRDVCMKFLKNNVPDGKFVGCKKWLGDEKCVQ